MVPIRSRPLIGCSLPDQAAGGAGGAGGRTLARRLLEEQRPKYQAAREALGERKWLLSRVDPDMLALPPGARVMVACLRIVAHSGPVPCPAACFRREGEDASSAGRRGDSRFLCRARVLAPQQSCL